MRISGGAARGVSLQVPKGSTVRPATDGLRQSVFSSLAAMIPDAIFADLFAGSGSYGLEAFSRGAAGGVFVEKNARSIACMGKNIAAVCKSSGRTAAALKVVSMDALAWRGDETTQPDLVFVDPPYEIIPQIADTLFKNIAAATCRKSGAVVVFEMPGEMMLSPEGWRCARRLGKGTGQPTAAFFVKG